MPKHHGKRPGKLRPAREILGLVKGIRVPFSVPLQGTATQSPHPTWLHQHIQPITCCPYRGMEGTMVNTKLQHFAVNQTFFTQAVEQS